MQPNKTRISRVLFAIPLLLLCFCGLRAPTAAQAVEKGRGAVELFSIEVRDADVSDVLRALAQQSGYNIIIGEGVDGKVSLSFKDIPFKDALEIVIKSRGLMYTIHNNVFWVGKKVDLSGEMSVDMIKLNNADSTSTVPHLKGILSAEGTAFADTRTNSVIIRDLPRNVEHARQLLKKIDVQTSQVIIEARIVEATSTFARQFGIQWGGSYTSGSDQITGSQLLATSSADRNFAVNFPASAATSGLGIILGNLSNNLLLDIELTAAESKGELRIISRPRITAINNKPATIHSGLTFRVKLSQAIVTGGDTSTTTSSLGGLEEIKTGIDLTVTPQISGDGYILLNITTNKSDPDYTHTVDGIPGVSEKSATTNVLIKDGDTVVIGGLYKSSTSDQGNAVPFLSNIPVLGALFEGTSKNVDKEELLVFITPQIIRYDAAKETLN